MALVLNQPVTLAVAFADAAGAPVACDRVELHLRREKTTSTTLHPAYDKSVTMALADDDGPFDILGVIDESMTDIQPGTATGEFQMDAHAGPAGVYDGYWYGELNGNPVAMVEFSFEVVAFPF